MKLFLNRNFACMFFGRILTNVGDSLYAVAAMWLVYDLGGSTFYTGLAGFLTILPRMIQLLAGPIIDRLPIRKLLITTQLTQALLLLIIPVASYYGFLTVTLVLIISPILTTLNMFVYPAQMAALPSLVENDDLTKANSYFTVAYQGIEIGCNAIAGVLIVAIGAVSIYVLDSVMFLIGAILFSLLRVPAAPKITSTENKNLQTFIRTYVSELKEGVSVLFNKTLSKLLIGVIGINLVGGATFVVLPAFSDYKGGVEIYGLLLMAQAAGSLTGALLTPYLKLERFGLGKVYAYAFIVSGILWSVAIFSPWTWLVVTLYGLAWLPGGITNILINTVLQKGIPKKLLGRVFSAAYSVSGIALPLGSMAGGVLGVYIGSQYVIALSGIVVLCVGLGWLIDKQTRSLPKINEINESTFIKDQPKDMMLTETV
ncbi:MFS transporter [Alkalihalophilus marmarensis]|uniref:MFS transporter n=1 Tax=Alkalihalophilus marmarensis DSM 21297 TaxID=1188261 RepID=U6SS56_9BACI|nr:MFS transporter [Alkalihalophilus marmarensis]ERN53750.1 MFS transporter [Alkalihalophilus marmarensis DSM 21297]MCM3490618.1 MFS transporter [Alkalihalophilus marmarensis]